jgi:hypothetical protein
MNLIMRLCSFVFKAFSVRQSTLWNILAIDDVRQSTLWNILAIDDVKKKK